MAYWKSKGLSPSTVKFITSRRWRSFNSSSCASETHYFTKDPWQTTGNAFLFGWGVGWSGLKTLTLQLNPINKATHKPHEFGRINRVAILTGKGKFDGLGCLLSSEVNKNVNLIQFLRILHVNHSFNSRFPDLEGKMPRGLVFFS